MKNICMAILILALCGCGKSGSLQATSTCADHGALAGVAMTGDSSNSVYLNSAEVLPSGSDARTVTAWITKDVTNATSGIDVAFFMGTAAVGEGFYLGVHNGTKLIAGAYGDDLESSDAPIAGNHAAHIAVTYDGSGVFDSSNVLAYVNGIAMSMIPYQNSGTTFSTVGTSYTFDNIPGQSGYGFNGTVSNVHVYSRALSAAEIQEDCTCGDTTGACAK